MKTLTYQNEKIVIYIHELEGETDRPFSFYIIERKTNTRILSDTDRFSRGELINQLILIFFNRDFDFDLETREWVGEQIFMLVDQKVIFHTTQCHENYRISHYEDGEVMEQYAVMHTEDGHRVIINLSNKVKNAHLGCYFELKRLNGKMYPKVSGLLLGSTVLSIKDTIDKELPFPYPSLETLCVEAGGIDLYMETVINVNSVLA